MNEKNTETVSELKEAQVRKLTEHFSSILFRCFILSYFHSFILSFFHFSIFHYTIFFFIYISYG
jgi:hypothetical protein